MDSNHHEQRAIPEDAPDAPITRARPSPLWAVVAVTWLTSFGTAVAWAGVFFVADREYDFSRERNLLLAVLLGLVYAVAAWFARPVAERLRRLRQGPEPLSHRAVLGMVIAAAGLIALLPLLARQEWSIWVFGLLYQPLTGLIWPLVESYVSSGRRGRDLGRAAGRFNIAWASALIAAMWAMVPLMDEHALWVIGGLTPLHVASIIFLYGFTRDPGAHGSAAHPHTPDEAARFRRLLHLFRACLTGSYVLHAAATPMLPEIMDNLGVRVSWRTALASVWMITRLASFTLMERWSGWHGDARVAAWAVGCMLVGFFGVLLAPTAAILGVALAVLGVGIGAVYAGAIYYALEVGSTDVDAGGRHEAMIGLGYTLGPFGSLMLLGMLGSGG